MNLKLRQDLEESNKQVRKALRAQDQLGFVKAASLVASHIDNKTSVASPIEIERIKMYYED